MSALRRLLPRRVAVLSVHTSPLDQPGTGDAGGMNVYIVETARRLAEHGVEVEIFTRATSGDLPPVVELAPGVQVRHLPAGPFEPLAKEDLPGLLCSFSTGLLRVEALHEPGYFDLVHSHYWLSGQVGTLGARPLACPPRSLDAHDGAREKPAGLQKAIPPSRRLEWWGSRRWSTPPTDCWPTPRPRQTSW